MKTHNQFVSIIIPVHNRSEELKQCLCSVADQTYPNIEVIIVDDASTEDMKSVVSRINWPATFTVQFIRQNENQGPGFAREVGRKKASGSFINYLDSDDVLNPEKIARQVAELNNHSEAGMCYCSSIEFSQLPLTGDEKYRARSNQRYCSFLPIILQGRPWGTSACLWTREAVDKIGPWFPGWGWEDLEYDSRAGCLDIEIIHLPLVLCYYRKDPSHNQLSNTDELKAAQYIGKSILQMSRNLRKYKKTDSVIIQMRLQSILYRNCLILMRSGNDQDSEQCLLELIKVPTRKVVRKIRYIFVYIIVKFFGSKKAYYLERRMSDLYIRLKGMILKNEQ